MCIVQKMHTGRCKKTKKPRIAGLFVMLTTEVVLPRGLEPLF